MIGQVIGPYQVLSKLGEGGPPPFARESARTSASLAVAQARLDVVNGEDRIGPYLDSRQAGRRRHGRGVSRARHRLKRDVALKVLPPELATDRERLARFQREAEVLASLNHPTHRAHVRAGGSLDSRQPSRS